MKTSPTPYRRRIMYFAPISSWLTKKYLRIENPLIHYGRR